MTVNRSMNYAMRRVLYSLKREYGSRVDVYKLIETGTNLETGEKTFTSEMHIVRRCIVLPVKILREVSKTVSQIAANKAFVYGGTYDAGTRSFILDARDLPPGFEFTNDDYLIYNNRRYEIRSIEEFEQHTGWVLIGLEMRGVRPQQTIRVKAESFLQTDTITGKVEECDLTSNLTLDDSTSGIKIHDEVLESEIDFDAFIGKLTELFETLALDDSITPSKTHTANLSLNLELNDEVEHTV